MVLVYSRGRALEYDISQVLENVKPDMGKEEIQDIVFNDFGHYNGFDRALLLMKTDEIINEIINQISIGGSSNGE